MRKSNHSLRATAATKLIDAGVAEKVIMDRTGHRSLDGLKPYCGIAGEKRRTGTKFPLEIIDL